MNEDTGYTIFQVNIFPTHDNKMLLYYSFALSNRVLLNHDLQKQSLLTALECRWSKTQHELSLTLILIYRRFSRIICYFQMQRQETIA